MAPAEVHETNDSGIRVEAEALSSDSLQNCSFLLHALHQASSRTYMHGASTCSPQGVDPSAEKGATSKNNPWCSYWKTNWRHKMCQWVVYPFQILLRFVISSIDKVADVFGRSSSKSRCFPTKPRHRHNRTCPSRPYIQLPSKTRARRRATSFELASACGSTQLFGLPKRSQTTLPPFTATHVVGDENAPPGV